jgi:putative PIG3 family NAD(P)H quinone oxidoreductase
MRAVVLEEKGGPEVLTLREVPDPEPGPEELLVDVVATALNRADLLQRRGLYPGPPMAHEIPGLEFAGRVAAVGERVTAHAVGDPVMGIVGGGAYASRLVTHERQALAVPESVGPADAAAVPEVFITAWDALVLQGGLTSGRVALVHAGASGVGTAAIQIARAIGARVVVTASAGKVAACRELGADLAVDYGTDDFVEAARAVTGGRGVDTVLDVVGGDYLRRNLEALAVGGRIVQVGTMGDGTATFPLGLMQPKRATLVGTVLRARPLEEKIAVTQRFGRELLPLFDQGILRPVIDRRYPLEAVADAHRHMEANANVGKIVLDVAPPT